MSSIISIFGRIVITVIALLIIYLLLGPLSYVENDMINETFYLFIVAPILIICTILLSFLIGFPIRNISSLYNWWINRPYVALIILIAGIAFCLFSTQAQFAELKTIVTNGEEITEHRPNFSLLCIGWFMTSFSLTHFYLRSFIQIVKSKSQPKKKHQS